jgi:hypothetical protein
VSADQLAHEQAIIQLGLGAPQLALGELDRIVAPELRASNRFFHAYVQSLVDGEDGNAFRARVARQDIRYAGDSATLAAADRLAAAEVTGAAFDMLMYWLAAARPGSRPDGGVDVGLELVLQLSEADDAEGKAILLRRLHEVYPTNARIGEELKELEDLSRE